MEILLGEPGGVTSLNIKLKKKIINNKMQIAYVGLTMNVFEACIMKHLAKGASIFLFVSRWRSNLIK